MLNKQDFSIEKNNIIINFNNIEFDNENTKFIMKKIMTKFFFCKNLNFIVDNESLLEESDSYVLENKFQVLTLINTLKIKNKKDRDSYIYDKICFYLDSVCISKNLCDFKDDICFGKRKYCVKNGCCHTFKSRWFVGLKEKPTLCQYQVNKSCTACSMGCKMFLCDEVIKEKGVKFTVNNVFLIKYYYNFIQKIIILSSVFQKKEVILNKLNKFGN